MFKIQGKGRESKIRGAKEGIEIIEDDREDDSFEKNWERRDTQECKLETGRRGR